MIRGVTTAFAFGAGMLAAFNPCAFAMLPSFLAYFLGVENEEFARLSPVRRGLVGVGVGLLISLGFLLIFSLAGVIFAALGSGFVRVIPWLALVVGVLLTVFGLLLLLGREPHISFTNPVAGIRGRGPRALFLYGVAYGVASLSCTLPIFLGVVGSALAAGSLLGGLLPFFGYSAGMALVLVTLTVSVALVKGALIRRLRVVLPYVNKLAGILLLGAGAYIVYFQVNFSIFLW